MKHWDWIIITAANELQAKGFRRQLEQRISEGFLPKESSYLVIPDPPGERIGNGGSTLNALRSLAENHGLEGTKSLVLLCSGDSKGVPEYSALGKIFSPVPRTLENGRASALFDEIILSMKDIPEKMEPGMFVLSGDVLLSFDPSYFQCSGEDAIALSFPESAEEGCGHGVFIPSPSGNIAGVVHKQPVEVLRKIGAVSPEGCVNIDTGAVWFSPRVMHALYTLICDENGCCTDSSFRKYVNGHIAPSLYVDFFYPLTENADYAGYCRETPEHLMSGELLEMREAIWLALRPFRIRLCCIPDSKFIHFGSSAEVAELMHSGIEAYAKLGWKRTVSGKNESGADCASWCSLLEAGAHIAGSAFIEASRICCGAEVGEGSIVSFCRIEPNMQVPADVLLFCCRLNSGAWCALICGVKEKAKNSIEEIPADTDRILSYDELSANKKYELQNSAIRRIDDILKRQEQMPAEIWPDTAAHTLWNAKIYPVRNTMKEALEAALHFWQDEKIPQEPRISMWDSFNSADAQDLADRMQQYAEFK